MKAAGGRLMVLLFQTVPITGPHGKIVDDKML